VIERRKLLQPDQSFAEFLAELYAARFTGKLEIDVFNGVPRAVALPGPKVTFAAPVKQKVDKRDKLADAVTV
jgi:hypothetical protein